MERVFLPKGFADLRVRVFQSCQCPGVVWATAAGQGVVLWSELHFRRLTLCFWS